MEPVKNRLTRLGRNARTLVVDPDPDLVADARHGDLDEASWRREAHCIVDDGVDRPCKAVRLAHDDGCVLAWAGEGEAGIAGFAACLPAVDELLDQRSEIDPFEGGARKFGVRPRGFADVA